MAKFLTQADLDAARAKARSAPAYVKVIDGKTIVGIHPRTIGYSSLDLLSVEAYQQQLDVERYWFQYWLQQDKPQHRIKTIRRHRERRAIIMRNLNDALDALPSRETARLVDRVRRTGNQLIRTLETAQ